MISKEPLPLRTNVNALQNLPLETTIPGIVKRGRFLMAAKGCGESHSDPSVDKKCNHQLVVPGSNAWWVDKARKAHVPVPINFKGFEKEEDEKKLNEKLPPFVEKADNLHVILWTWSHNDDRTYAPSRILERVNVIGEQYQYTTLATHADAQDAETVPKNFENKITTFRGRLALVEGLEEQQDEKSGKLSYQVTESTVSYGYFPRWYLMPLLVWAELRALPEWYVGKIKIADALMLANQYEWPIGSFIIHEIDCGNKDNFKQHCHPMYLLIAAVDADATQPATVLIARDVFGRYRLASHYHAPFSSLFALAARLCGLGMTSEERAKATPMMPLWLKGGPRPISNQKSSYTFDYPPPPPFEPSLDEGELDAHAMANVSVMKGDDNIGGLEMLNPEDVEWNEKDKLGEGNFGICYKGKMKRQETTQKRQIGVSKETNKSRGPSTPAGDITVAIKIINVQKMLEQNPEAVTAVRRELNTLAKINHAHCVRTYGVFTTAEENWVIVMELVKVGSALNYLQSMRDNKQRISINAMLNMLYQIADAFVYLGKKKIVHRDLALRNILIHNIDPLDIKVADFGLAQHQQEGVVAFRKEVELPWAWMPPEAITTQKFSTKSDVWSFGILAWEIMTQGGEPYASIETTNLAQVLISGYRLERPPDIPDQLWDFIELRCWSVSAKERPSFRTIRMVMSQLQGGDRKPPKHISPFTGATAREGHGARDSGANVAFKMGAKDKMTGLPKLSAAQPKAHQLKNEETLRKMKANQSKKSRKEKPVKGKHTDPSETQITKTNKTPSHSTHKNK